MIRQVNSFISSPTRPQSQPAPTVAPSVLEAIPDYAKDIVVDFRAGKIPTGLNQAALTEAAKQEVGKGLFAAQMLASQDEKAGKDEAMGVPGKVVQGNTSEVFVIPGAKQIEAVITSVNAQTGEPATLYVFSGPQGASSIGILNHGSSVEVHGQVLVPTGPNQFDGYVINS